MQISTVRVFVLVEGRDSDPYFYDNLCRSVCMATNVAYRIVRAEQIGLGGGKATLFQFFDYLRTVNSLLDNFAGKRTIAIFLVDKDLDDILHSKIFSDHVVYTRYYSIENYFFVHGDILGAACAAASLERAILEPEIGDPNAWPRRMAKLWKDWVTLCLFSLRHDLQVQSNYRRNESAINVPPLGNVDGNLLDDRKAELEAALGLGVRAFNRAYRCVERLVDRLYQTGRHDTVFKGKWYIRLLTLQTIAAAAATNRTFASHALSNAIASALRQSLNFEDPWADHLKTPLQQLLARP